MGHWADAHSTDGRTNTSRALRAVLDLGFTLELIGDDGSTRPGSAAQFDIADRPLGDTNVLCRRSTT